MKSDVSTVYSANPPNLLGYGCARGLFNRGVSYRTQDAALSTTEASMPVLRLVGSSGPARRCSAATGSRSRHECP